MYAGHVDALASLLHTGLEVDLAGTTWNVEYRCATQWLTILMDEQVDAADIIPGMLGEEEQQQMEALLFDGSLQPLELHSVALEILDWATGHPWWWGIRLLSLSHDGRLWPRLHGRLVRDGLNPDLVSIGEYLHALYSVLLETIPEGKAADLDRDLELPPAGIAVTVDVESEEATFLAMMNTPD